MADVNKTIDIQIKADMKEMLRELKRMPNMAGDEAKKMVNQLKRQFQRAEIAAKKQAKAHALANQKMANSTKNATNSIVQNLDRQQRKQKSLRVQSRELGASLGSLEDVVGELSPELGALAATAGTLGAAFRTLARSMATGNPIVLALVASVGALAGAYHLLTSATREAERRQKLMKDGVEQANAQLAEQAQIIRNLNKQSLSINNQLLVQTGQMTQLEADIADAKADSANAANNDLLTQRKYILEQQQLLSIAKTMRSNHHALSQEEKDRLQTAMMLSGEAQFRHGFAEGETALYAQMGNLQDYLTKEISKQRTLANGIQDAHDKNLQTRIEILKNQDELNKAREESAREEDARAQREARQAKARAERQKKEAEDKAKRDKQEAEMARILNEIQRAGDKAKSNAENMSIANERLRISLLDDDIEKINQTMELEKSISESKIASMKAIQEQNLTQAQTEKQIEAAKQANLELDKQIEAERESASLKEQKSSQDRIKALKDEKKERLELLNTIVSSSVEGANAISTIIKNVGGENKKAALVAFRIQQAASLANIAMLTAEKVMQVAPNPFAMAGVGALGALQAGVVLSQSPPEKHMGGVITKGEDTQNITVLDGEAVLDRMTVQRLGGEQGINRLQRGMSMQPEIVVMNPFKHFDRYANANVRRGGSLASMANRKASGGY